jgi:hypothetical protein
VEILSNEESNADQQWDQMWRDVWPPNSRVRLVYQNGVELDIDAPDLRSDGEPDVELSRFVELLLSDLGD